MRAPPVGPIERVGGPLPGLDLSATLTATRRRLTGEVVRGFPAVDPVAEIDPLEAEFRLHSVTAGAVVTVIVCIPALFYVMTSARDSGKILLLAAWATSLVGAVIALVLPWEGIIRSAFLIDEQGKVAATFYKVSPKDTVPKVTAALKT